MPAKLAIALQCCPLDMYQAEELAELICNIEPQPREDVEFILVRRRDVNHLFSIQLEKMVKKKFPLFHDSKSRRFGTGWPLGPNDLWQDGMLRISLMHQQGSITADGVLTFEPDCIPISANWIDVLIAEWERAKLVGSHVCGSMVQPDSFEQHINGNAIFSCQITRSYPELNGSSQAWDFHHRKLICSLATATDSIKQMYNHKEVVSREQIMDIRQKGAVMIHGVKNSSVMDEVGKMLTEKSL